MSLLQSHIYASMVAGSLPAGDGRPDDAIAAVAAAALHDARLHVLVARDARDAFYFAVPSACISHGPGFATPLAAALPGHPGHQGDGMYALLLGDNAVAAVKRGAELFLLRLEEAALAAKAQVLGLPLHRLEHDGVAWPLESLFGRHRRAVEQHSAFWAKCAAIVLGACAVTYAAVAGAEAYAARHGGRLWHSTPVSVTVKQLQYTSPLFEQLAHFQRVSATVVRAGGWIDGYIWKQGKGEAFDIVMPGWISQDYVEALGPGAVADYNIPDNLVTVRKGDLEKLSKP